MYELTGKLKGVSVSYDTGKPLVTIEINEKQSALDMYDDLVSVEKLSFKIDKYRQKRSLNANSYAWMLMTEIGNVLRASKEEIYFKMLKEYGQVEVISAKAYIPISEYIKYSEEIGESTLKGELFKHYKVYKGSSQFDTREMAIFIDGIVSEAKALNIPTETPEQIAKMKSLWASDPKKGE